MNLKWHWCEASKGEELTPQRKALNEDVFNHLLLGDPEQGWIGWARVWRIDDYIIGAVTHGESDGSTVVHLAYAIEDLGPATDLALVAEENDNLFNLQGSGPEEFLIRKEELSDHLEERAA